jgi:nicotinamidase-related amidase
MTPLDPKTTALILIDLQKGIVARPELAPRSGGAVVQTASALAEKFRAAGAPVVLVNVAFAKDGGDALKAQVDRPRQMGSLPPEWSEIVDGLAKDSDLRVTKRNWGAFYGTDLDVQMRRRGIKTIVLGGIATNLGVESTARQGHEHGYEIVIVEDAMATMSAEMHSFAVTQIFPLLSRVVKAADIALGHEQARSPASKVGLPNV